jgi:hypothetical protein
MASIAENVMAAILARLQALPKLAPDVRRSHRIPVSREMAPCVHLVDGGDTLVAMKNDCRGDRKKAFTVSVFYRDDAGAAAADPMVISVNDRMNPVHATFSALPHNAILKQGDITPNEETADGDAVRIDMAFEFEYHTSGWRIDG